MQFALNIIQAESVITVYIFRARNLVKGKYDMIVKVEIVSVKELKQMIQKGKVENAGTLIAYLICCTEIF